MHDQEKSNNAPLEIIVKIWETAVKDFAKERALFSQYVRFGITIYTGLFTLISWFMIQNTDVQNKVFDIINHQWICIFYILFNSAAFAPLFRQNIVIKQHAKLLKKAEEGMPIKFYTEKFKNIKEANVAFKKVGFEVVEEAVYMLFWLLYIFNSAFIVWVAWYLSKQ